MVPTDDSSNDPLLYTVSRHFTEYVHEYDIQNSDIFSAYVETARPACGQYRNYFHSSLL
jgi:hypothetical protein